jgi:hypothetical protein
MFAASLSRTCILALPSGLCDSVAAAFLQAWNAQRRNGSFRKKSPTERPMILLSSGLCRSLLAWCFDNIVVFSFY